jgi:protein kinase
MFQAITAIGHLHRNGLMHRDLKPENFLVSTSNVEGMKPRRFQRTIKLADFGLVRNYRDKTGPPLTEYVSTRWYRAPEIVLRSKNYNEKVDIFALACNMAELYLRRPLFPGRTESEQLNTIISVLGTPLQKDWPEGYKLAADLGQTINQSYGKNEPGKLKPLFSQQSQTTISSYISDDAINLLEGMLAFDPAKRFTAQQCLSHPYF